LEGLSISHKLKILSWNINGIRAAEKKGFFKWFINERPDILCLQEIKANPNQVPAHLKNIPDYYTYWNSAEKKGYSGVSTISRYKPILSKKGFGIEKFDIEGRVLITEYPQFVLFNVYFPNGKKNQERLDFKLDFYNKFLDYVENIRSEDKNIVICGDFNTAHKEIDLARPKENERISGFLPIERHWIDKLIDHGYIDTFRFYNKKPNQYSWWDMKTRARDRNVGWRIDYFFVNNEFISTLKNAFILDSVMGSDHCPVGIELIL
jgi:exodeoxyribonuclease-3